MDPELAYLAGVVGRTLARKRLQIVHACSVVPARRTAAKIDLLLAVVAHEIGRTFANVAADHAVTVGSVQARTLLQADVDEDFTVDTSVSVRTRAINRAIL